MDEIEIQFDIFNILWTNTVDALIDPGNFYVLFFVENKHSIWIRARQRYYCPKQEKHIMVWKFSEKYIKLNGR